MTDYSRGDYADLPAGTTDLENNYTAPDLTAIASNDNSTYAEQTANNEIAIHQYKKTVTGQYTNITWSGKSSLAPSESPVILEVYNVTGTPAWEELDRDDSTAADTDFDIIYNNLATADYLDTGVITWRVWQAASGASPITYRQSYGTDLTGTGARSASTTVSVVENDLIVVMMVGTANKDFPPTDNDTGGSNTYYKVDQLYSSGTPLGAILMYWAKAKTTNASLLIKTPGNDNNEDPSFLPWGLIAVHVLYNQHPTTPVDNYIINKDTATTTHTSGNLVLSAASGIMIACWAQCDYNSTDTAGGTWGLRFNIQSGAGSTLDSLDLAYASPDTYTSQLNSGNNTAYLYIVAGFKGA